jgi:hypothetical protein
MVVDVNCSTRRRNNSIPSLPYTGHCFYHLLIKQDILQLEILLTALTSFLSTALCICTLILPMFREIMIPSFRSQLHVMMAETVVGAAARSHRNRADQADVAASRAGTLVDCYIH